MLLILVRENCDKYFVCGFFFQVILQSETIQELTKTSEALASVQQEACELRKVVDVLKTENVLFSSI